MIRTNIGLRKAKENLTYNLSECNVLWCVQAADNAVCNVSWCVQAADNAVCNVSWCVQAAGNAVKRATDALVRAAQQMNNEWHMDETDYSVDLRMVGGLAEVTRSLCSLGLSWNPGRIVVICFSIILGPRFLLCAGCKFLLGRICKCWDVEPIKCIQLNLMICWLLSIWLILHIYMVTFTAFLLTWYRLLLTFSDHCKWSSY